MYQRENTAGENYRSRPVQHPSPDRKNGNMITPTRSPELTEIKRTVTPIKNTASPFSCHTCCHHSHYYSSEIYCANCKSTEHKYSRNEENNEFEKMLNEKEETIKQLKDILEMIGKREGESREEANLEQDVRVLTIENQKLMNIIENHQIGTRSKREEMLISQITNLEKAMERIDFECRNSLSNLTKKLTESEENEKELKEENEKLMRMMKESLSDSQSNSGNSIPTKSKNNFEKDKLTLIRIRDQHAENIRLLKENFTVQMQQFFRPIQDQQNEISSYTASLESKINDLEQTCKNISILQKRESFSDEIERILLKQKECTNRLEEECRNNDYLTRELEIKKEELSQYQRKISKLENEMFAWKNDVHDEKEKKEYEIELNFKELSKEYEKYIESSKNEVLFLKNEINEAKIRENNLKALNGQIQLELQEFNSSTEVEIRKLMNNYEIEIEMLKDKLNKVIQELSYEEEENKELKKLKENLLSNNSKLTNENNLLNICLKDLKESLQKITEKNVELEIKANKMKNEKERAITELQTKIKENDFFREKVTQFEVELHKNEEEKEYLKESVKRKEQYQGISSGLKELEVLLEEYEINIGCEEFVKEYEQVKIDLLKINEEKELLNKQIEHLKEIMLIKFKEYNENKENFINEVEILKQKITVRDSQIEEMTERNIRLDNERSSMEKQYAMIKEIRFQAEIKKSSCRDRIIKIRENVSSLIETEKEQLETFKIDEFSKIGSSKLTLMEKLYENE